MTFLEDIKKKKDSLKSEVLNLVQRARAGKKVNAVDGAGADDEAEASDPDPTQPKKMNDWDSWDEEDEVEEDEPARRHGDWQQTTFKSLGGAKEGADICPIERDIKPGQTSGQSPEEERQIGAEPDTSHGGARNKCFSDSNCPLSLTLKGGKHVCKRPELRAATNMRSSLGTGESEGKKQDVILKNLPPGEPKFTNRRPRLERSLPVKVPTKDEFRSLIQEQSFKKRYADHCEGKVPPPLTDSDIESLLTYSRIDEDYKRSGRPRHAQSGAKESADIDGRKNNISRRSRYSQFSDIVEYCAPEDTYREKELARLNAIRGESARSMRTTSPQVGSERDPLEGLDDLLDEVENRWTVKEQVTSIPSEQSWGPCTDKSDTDRAEKQNEALSSIRKRRQELKRDLEIMDELLEELRNL